MSLPLGSAHYCSKQRRSQCLEQSKASAVRNNQKKYKKGNIAFNLTNNWLFFANTLRAVMLNANDYQMRIEIYKSWIQNI